MIGSRRVPLCVTVGMILFAWLAPLVVKGQTIVWTGVGSGNFSDGSNWQGGLAPTSSQTAEFDFAAYPTNQPFIDSGSVLGILFNPTSSVPLNYDFGSSGGTLNVGTGGMVLNTTGGATSTVQFNAPIALTATQTRTLGSGSES